MNEKQTYYQIGAVHGLAAWIESMHFSFINWFHNMVSWYLSSLSNRNKVMWMDCVNHKMKETFPFDLLSHVFTLCSDLTGWYLFKWSGSFNLKPVLVLITFQFYLIPNQYTFSEGRIGTESNYAFLKPAGVCHWLLGALAEPVGDGENPVL